MSVDCDCAGVHAVEPTMSDMGMVASTDILAIDQACCDFVYTATDSKDLRERMESQHGLHQLTDAELVAIGKKYNKTAAQVALRWNVQRGVYYSEICSRRACGAKL